MLGSYRAVLGHFEDDQWFMVASATVNLALSFILFPLFDITGALIATVVAHCIMWAGRIRVVFRQYMRGGLRGIISACRRCIWSRWLSAWAAATRSAPGCPAAGSAFVPRIFVVPVVPNAPEPRRLRLGQRRRLPAPVRGQGGQEAAEKVTPLGPSGGAPPQAVGSLPPATLPPALCHLPRTRGRQNNVVIL